MAEQAAIYWSVVSRQGWNILIAASSAGLCYASSDGEPFEEMASWLAKRYPGCEFVRDDEKMEPYARELSEYLKGVRREFTVPLDLRGTPFQLAVWNALTEIPYGETTTYSNIAERIRKPSAVRAVGGAIGANPALVFVPCHRVIGKDGSLTGFTGGIEMKKRLLGLEGSLVR